MVSMMTSQDLELIKKALLIMFIMTSTLTIIELRQVVGRSGQYDCKFNRNISWLYINNVRLNSWSTLRS